MQGDVPKKVWRLGKLNHVAIAVPDLEKATKLFREVLGANVSEPQVSVRVLGTSLSDPNECIRSTYISH